MHDLVISNGVLVDGTGADRRRADIGIDGGRITAVGEVGGGRRTIDADGRIVAPGFIDVHTHLDVQGFWDPTLSPSPLHGVTSVFGGNCGFSVQPLDEIAGDYLMRMLARVEGMPLQALQQGVPWDWRSTADYLDRVDGTLAINTGFMVGHSAIRRVVMGPAANQRASNAAELSAMEQLLRLGLSAGASGFSSTWSTSHSDADGDPVPSRFAGAQELIALARVTGEFEGTTLEFLPSVGGQGGFREDIAQLMVDMSVAAKRPLNWNVLVVHAKTADEAELRLKVGDQARAAGGKVVALTLPEMPPSRFSFLSGFVLDLHPGLHDFLFLPAQERLAILADPIRRQEVKTLSEQPSEWGHLTDWKSRQLVETFTDETKRYAGRRVSDIAEEERRDPYDVLMDIVVADGLRTTFSNPAPRYKHEDWEARAKVWRDPRAMVGASDAGAHLDMMSTFACPTMLLQHGVREEEVITLEEGIRMLTGQPAGLYGMVDRGVVREGAVADLVVLDETRVGVEEVGTRFDLPGGAGRLYAGAHGIDHVLVAGTEIAREGAFTGALPGRVLRAGTDTKNPSLD